MNHRPPPCERDTSAGIIGNAQREERCAGGAECDGHQSEGRGATSCEKKRIGGIKGPKEFITQKRLPKLTPRRFNSGEQRTERTE